MTRFLRLLPVAMTLLVGSGAHAQTPTTVPGWTFTMNVTTDSGDAGGHGAAMIRFVVGPHQLRWAALQLGAEGQSPVELFYMILNSEDSTLTAAVPSQHRAVVMDLASMDAAKKGGVSYANRRLTKSELEDLGDGGRILDHATHHYRVTMVGTVDIVAAGRTCTSRIDAVSDLWIAPDLDLGSGLPTALKQFGLSTGVDMSVDDHGVAPVKVPKGMSLRSVARSTTPNATGKEITVKTTSEVVELMEEDINVARFRVPDDIQTNDVRKSMGRATIDSTLKAGAAATSEGIAKSMCASSGTP